MYKYFIGLLSHILHQRSEEVPPVLQFTCCTIHMHVHTAAMYVHMCSDTRIISVSIRITVQAASAHIN